jgi:hypothetical protein
MRAAAASGAFLAVIFEKSISHANGRSQPNEHSIGLVSGHWGTNDVS